VTDFKVDGLLIEAREGGRGEAREQGGREARAFDRWFMRVMNDE
jgi:hypothetical protein